MSDWIWVVCLGAAGGGASAWLAGVKAGSHDRRHGLRPGLVRRRLALLVLSASTAAAIAWMVGGPAPISASGSPALPSALAFFWIGFVTAGWAAALRDVHVLRAAVCRAATAPAAHPDTVSTLTHASADAVYDTVVSLLPRRVAR